MLRIVLIRPGATDYDCEERIQGALDIPLNRHITLSGFYNRSLRNKIDTAGFSLTFLLRPATQATNAK